jgi:hypothetical protein
MLGEPLFDRLVDFDRFQLRPHHRAQSSFLVRRIRASLVSRGCFLGHGFARYL